MMILGQLRFSAGWPMVLLGVVVLLVGGWLAWTAWRRAARPKRTGALELLRLLILLLGVLILWKPEWVTMVFPDEEPETVVLWDDSASMQTEDVALFSGGDGESSKAKVRARAAVVEEILQTKFWEEMEEDGLKKGRKVTVKAFGSVKKGGEKTSGTNLHEALSEVAEGHANLRSVVLLSDGDYNLGDPPVSVAGLLRSKEVPVYALAMGSERRLPDVVVEEVNAPTYGIVGENVQIPFRIVSSLDRAVNTTVRLREKGGEERSKSVSIPARGTLSESMIWKVQSEGVAELELSVPFMNGELLEDNNALSFRLNGKPESIRVLVVESRPRWEYRFIRNALSRDPGVAVDCLLLHPTIGAGDGPDYIQEFPEKLEDLQKYDVVFVGDIGVGPGQLTQEQADLLAGLVKSQASGVVFIPGPLGNQASLAGSKLGELLPVELKEGGIEGVGAKVHEGVGSDLASSLELTSEGRGSLLTMLGDTEEENPLIWKSLPGFFWYLPVERAKSGAQVLAVHGHASNRFGRLPLLVTSRAGSGKVLFMGIDSAWRWRRGVEDRYHYRFWGQVARWMSYQRNMAAGEAVRLYHTPERPKAGEQVVVRANAFDSNGAPLKEGPVFLDVKGPDGATERVTLEKSGEQWGAFQGSFEVDETGAWELEAMIPGDEREGVKTGFTVPGEQLEKVGLPARPDVLAEIASVTRGALIEYEGSEQLADLVKQMNNLPAAMPRVTVVPLWSHWLIAVVMVLLMTLFWVGRKLNGTF